MLVENQENHENSYKSKKTVKVHTRSKVAANCMLKFGILYLEAPKEP